MIRVLSVGPIGENVHIVENPGSPLVVVDPGAEPERIVSEALTSAGRSGAAEAAIALTHGHLDHVAALARVAEGLASAGLRVRIYAPEGDRAYFGSSAYATNERVFEDISGLAFLKKHWSPVPEADEYFGDGFVIPGTEILAIHTPGHSPGSSCFLAEGGADLISGDTLFQGGRGRTDTFDADEDALFRSIRDKLLSLGDIVRVWPGHGGRTTIGRERRCFP